MTDKDRQLGSGRFWAPPELTKKPALPLGATDPPSLVTVPTTMPLPINLPLVSMTALVHLPSASINSSPALILVLRAARFGSLIVTTAPTVLITA